MRLFPSRGQWAKFSLPSKVSFLGSLFSVLGVIVTIVIYIVQSAGSTYIDERIQELDEIKAAFTALSS